MRANSSILTFATAISVGSNTFAYLNLIAAHTGGDWSQHNQVRLFPIGYVEPISGHTVTNCVLLRVQLSGLNADGSGDGAFSLPAIISGASSAPLGAPIIAQQPVDLTIFVGQVARFQIYALSPVPVTFQWRKAGVNIPNATTSAYVIPSAALTDAGAYSVVLTNSFGSVTSGSADLTVLPLPPGVSIHFDGSADDLFGNFFNFTPIGAILNATSGS
jgi:hypothetical protein